MGQVQLVTSLSLQQFASESFYETDTVLGTVEDGCQDLQAGVGFFFSSFFQMAGKKLHDITENPGETFSSPHGPECVVFFCEKVQVFSRQLYK